MIRKNLKEGKHDNITMIEMGTGDILIQGMEWEQENSFGLVLSQSHPRDIEYWNGPFEEGMDNFDNLDNPVIIKFTRKESVNQLIKSLSEIKLKFEKDD